MRVPLDRWTSVTNYLRKFCRADSPVLYTPVGDAVRASVSTGQAYAQYTFEPTEPLKERFCVRVRTLDRIGLEATGNEIEYHQGSKAKLTSKHSTWWVLPVTITDSMDPPKVELIDQIRWDSTLISSLHLAKGAARESDEKSCLDCVYVEVRRNDRRVVATNGTTMIVIRNRTPMEEWEEPARLLVEGSQVERIADTCESGSRIKINIGFGNYSVECGKRLAVFGMRTDAFPKSWSNVYDVAKHGRRYGVLTVDYQKFRQAFRQAELTGSVIQFKPSSGATVASAMSAEGESEIGIDAKTVGEFGPVCLSAELVGNIVKGWPFDRIRLEYLGPKSPVVFSSPSSMDTLGMVMPVEIGNER